jgi:hypothetical protein
MLFTIGHGNIIVPGRAASTAGGIEAAGSAADPNMVPRADVAPAGGDAGAGIEAAGPAVDFDRQAFGYFFPAADGPADAATMTARLDALGDAMAEPNDAGDVSGLAPILTYFGQFIDHDITAATDSDQNIEPLRIGKDVLSPVNRSLAATAVKNLRRGTLGLDSVYGDGPGQAAAVAQLEQVLRHPDGMRMRVGAVTLLPGNAVPSQRPDLPLPEPGSNPLVVQADLPRVGRLVAEGALSLDDLPAPLKPRPGDTAGNWERAAFIGDARNDENLIVAQLHVAVLRFHNAVVDWLESQGTASFEAARRLTRWHYQWLVVNAYLRGLCDPQTLDDVIAGDARLYRHFLADGRAPGAMPFEFSAAAFRFGHSMVRAAYDFNVNFNLSPGAIPGTFELLFAFTGRAPVNPIGGAAPPVGGHKTLPQNWIIEWRRFLAAGANTAARPIDTRLALPLGAMGNEATDVADARLKTLFQHLARRNLRRGYVLNLPTAQALVGKLTDAGMAPHRMLTRAEIAGPDGALQDAVVGGNFDTATPLWFYVLREAEVVHHGRHLGPLGSRLVAETLVGLIATDPDSYWNRGGPARWTPDDGAKPNHETIDGFAPFLRAAGVL